MSEQRIVHFLSGRDPTRHKRMSERWSNLCGKCCQLVVRNFRRAVFLRGQAKSWIGILSNIDEQKQAEEALREASARLRLIVESAGVGTLDWNLESDEIDQNVSV